ELFGGREAEVVVNLLPVPDRLRRLLEAGKLVPTPELLVIDPMATLNLAVLLRPARPDVPVPDPRLLDTQREGQGELGAVVILELAGSGMGRLSVPPRRTRDSTPDSGGDRGRGSAGGCSRPERCTGRLSCR